MIINSLFIKPENLGIEGEAIKSKFSNSSYLFSDIIKIVGSEDEKQLNGTSNNPNNTNQFSTKLPLVTNINNFTKLNLQGVNNIVSSTLKQNGINQSDDSLNFQSLNNIINKIASNGKHFNVDSSKNNKNTEINITDEPNDYYDSTVMGSINPVTINKTAASKSKDVNKGKKDVNPKKGSIILTDQTQNNILQINPQNSELNNPLYSLNPTVVISINNNNINDFKNNEELTVNPDEGERAIGSIETFSPWVKSEDLTIPENWGNKNILNSVYSQINKNYQSIDTKQDQVTPGNTKVNIPVNDTTAIYPHSLENTDPVNFKIDIIQDTENLTNNLATPAIGNNNFKKTEQTDPNNIAVPELLNVGEDDLNLNSVQVTSSSEVFVKTIYNSTSELLTSNIDDTKPDPIVKFNDSSLHIESQGQSDNLYLKTESPSSYINQFSDSNNNIFAPTSLIKDWSENRISFSAKYSNDIASLSPLNTNPVEQINTENSELPLQNVFDIPKLSLIKGPKTLDNIEYSKSSFVPELQANAEISGKSESIPLEITGNINEQIQPFVNNAVVLLDKSPLEIKVLHNRKENGQRIVVTDKMSYKNQDSLSTIDSMNSDKTKKRSFSKSISEDSTKQENVQNPSSTARSKTDKKPEEPTGPNNKSVTNDSSSNGSQQNIIENKSSKNDIPNYNSDSVSSTIPKGVTINTEETIKNNILKNNADTTTGRTADVNIQNIAPVKGAFIPVKNTSMASDPVTRETVQPEFLKVKPEDLVKEIHRVLTSDDSRKVILNLQPEDLGNVKIEFDLKEKSMNAKISVETESAKNLIQTNSETLKNSLHSSGITLNSLNVLLSDGPRQQHVPIIKKKIQKNEIIEIQAEPVQIKRRNLGYNTYEYLA